MGRFSKEMIGQSVLARVGSHPGKLEAGDERRHRTPSLGDGHTGEASSDIALATHVRLTTVPGVIAKLPRWIWPGAWLLGVAAGIVNAVGFLSFNHQAITHLTG